MYFTNEFVDSLPSVPLEDRKLLPDSAGIYLAIAKDKIVLYVGKSIRVRFRWRQHHRFQELVEIGDVRIAWVEVSDPALLLEIEKALISHFKPPLNGVPMPILRTAREKKPHVDIRFCVKPEREKRLEKRVKSKPMAVWIEPRLLEEFSEYCDRVKATKSDVLREYIDFLIEHPELEEYGTGKELLEKMLEALKASPVEKYVHDSCTY
jgi:hypothetical protein